MRKILLATPRLNLKKLRDEFGDKPVAIHTITKGKYNALDALYEYSYDFDAAIIDLIQARGDGLSLTEELRWNERLRGRHPMTVVWLSDVPIEDGNEVDPLSLGVKEFGIARVYLCPCDVTGVVADTVEMLATPTAN